MGITFAGASSTDPSNPTGIIVGFDKDMAPPLFADSGDIPFGTNITETYGPVPVGKVWDVVAVWCDSTVNYRVDVMIDGVIQFLPGILQARVPSPREKIPTLRLVAGEQLQLKKYNQNSSGNASIYSTVFYAERNA